MSTKISLVKLLLLSLAISMLNACAPAQSTETRNVPLRVEYTEWWGDYTLIVAEEAGIFDKYGVSVEPVFYETYEDSYSDLAAGIIDGGLLALDDAININDKSPIKSVAVYDDGGFYYLIGSTELKNNSDLRGKRIGVNIGSYAELIVLQALREGGLNIGDVTLVDMTVEDIPNYLGDTIDAGVTWDPYAAEAIKNGGNILLKSGGTNSIIPDVIVFSADVLNNRPDDIRAFLKAWFEAVDFRIANPDKANLLISAKMKIPVDEITADTQIFTLQENIVLFSDQTPQNMINIKTAFDVNANFLLSLGVLSKQPSMEQSIDPSYLFQQ